MARFVVAAAEPDCWVEGRDRLLSDVEAVAAAVADVAEDGMEDDRRG